MVEAVVGTQVVVVVVAGTQAVVVAAGTLVMTAIGLGAMEEGWIHLSAVSVNDIVRGLRCREVVADRDGVVDGADDSSTVVRSLIIRVFPLLNFQKCFIEWTHRGADTRYLIPTVTFSVKRRLIISFS